MEDEVVIELQHVDVYYGRRPALQDVSLEVRRGEFLAIFGPNGSGKTTLLRTVLGLVQPTSGTVRVFGRPPAELGADRRRLGYVPQLREVDPLFPIQVADVVMMGRYGRVGLFRRPTAADWEAVRWALAQVGLADLGRRQIGELSGGQQQRVFVARALANEPEVLLLDEPMAGFDIAMTEGLYELLHQLHDRLSLTILLVSHDVGAVSQRVDRIACVSNRLVVHGRPSEIPGEQVLECIYGPEMMFFSHGPVPHLVVTPRDHGEEEGQSGHDHDHEGDAEASTST